ncbi:putative leucine-rich repeat-containing protein DDB_G0290503 [Chironomus tepperi]|uniref:putative leucine-rich repeat-containing protein DDB_G0290503 n=1 Tax=Chironomus tepperi TaxID=113505 RepID=UPI00391F00A1
MTLNQLISIGDFTQVFDDQQLNLLLEESEISINLNFVKLDDNFKDLFKPRELIKKQKNSTESVNLSQDELIKDIKTEKFILISDNAGAGKSWTMKHISIDLCKTYPDRWISYVDLKHFINDFKSYNGVPELQDFMISTVLKSLNQFEIRMFKHLYTNGKVSILFDAFDEIAPDFASFLIGMIQSVNKHIGNQLFITTRDYFEDNLSEELKINSIYKLKPLTLIEIINMLEEKLKLCDKSKNSKNYQDIARKLAQRIRGIKNRSIGSPQFLKMIVDVYESIKDNKGSSYRNLFQKSLISAKEIKTIQILWKDYSKLCKSTDEFLKLLDERDQFGDNSLHTAAHSGSYDTFQFIIDELDQITNHKNINILLSSVNSFNNQSVLHLAGINNKSLKLHETLWRNFRKFFDSSDLLNFITRLDEDGDNFMYDTIVYNTHEVIKYAWKEVEEVLNSNDYIKNKFNDKIEHCKRLIEKKTKSEKLTYKEITFLNLKWIDYQNIGNSKIIQEILQKNNNFTGKDLNTFVADETIKNHELLWEHLTKFGYNKAQLMNLLIEKDQDGDNFIHNLVILNTAEVIEFTLHKIKENLNDSHYQEILRSKGQKGRNILHLATIGSKEVKTHQTLWQIFRDSCNSDDKFLEILQEVDNDGSNVFDFVALFSTCEIFQFMITELESITSREEIRKLLKTLGFLNRNLLQSAAHHNTCLELHEILWKNLEKYFDASEILQFIKHRDDFGCTVLLNVIEVNSKEIKELTWNKVKKVLKSNGFEDTKCDEIMKKDLKFWKLSKAEKAILTLEWISIANSVELFEDRIKLFNNRTIPVESLKDLMLFIADQKIENHQILWENLIKNCKNKDKLKNLFLDKDQNGNNYIHLLVIYNNPDIIEFTINKFKKHLTDSDYQEILRSKGEKGQNLLQLAAVDSKEVKTHQMLWQIFQNSCKSDHEFLEILREVDGDGSDILNLVASFSSGEIFQFLITELEKENLEDETRKLLKNIDCWGRHVLQSACRSNKSVDLHQTLWKIIKKYFNSIEIFDFIKNFDYYGNNILTNAVKFNSKEVIEFTWKEIEKHFININCYTAENHDTNIKKCDQIVQKSIKSIKLTYDEIYFLKLKWIEIKEQTPSMFLNKIKQVQFKSQKDLNKFVRDKSLKSHEHLWKQILTNLTKFGNSKARLMNLLIEKDQDGNNFIHNLVILNTAEVIKFTLHKIKENLNDSHYQEILRSKGRYGQNLLQLAAIDSKEVKTHQTLWQIFRDSCISDDKFLEILQEVDDNGCNIFDLVATFSTGKIFQFMINKLESITSPEEIRKLLRTLGFMSRNLLQSAAQQNTCLELHEILWKNLEKYFDASEILQFIKHRNNFGHNVLLNVINKNTKEIKKLTWNKVKKVLNSNGFEDTKCDEIMKKDLKPNELTKEEKRLLNLEWIQITNSVELFEDRIKLFNNRTIPVESLKDLMLFIADQKIENHQILWENLIKNYKNKDKLKNLFLEKNRNCNNYIHLLVSCNTAEVIEFTLQKFEENLNDSDYQEILRSKGYRGLNLLQTAAVYSKEVKTHQMLWQIFRDSCNSDDEFLEILREADEKGYSLINYAACYSDHHIMKFSIEELENITKVDELKSFLKLLDNDKQNMLQNAVIVNKNLEVHKYLWQKIPTIFNSVEILDFINNYCIDGFHILHDATYWNVKEIAEFTWSQIQIYISNKDDQVKYLTKLTTLNKNIHDLAIENKSKDPEIVAWTKDLMQKYDINF